MENTSKKRKRKEEDITAEDKPIEKRKSKSIAISLPKEEDLAAALIKSNDLQTDNEKYIKEHLSLFKNEKDHEKMMNAFKSIILFGQFEGGAGVNITKEGLIMTCAHCLNRDLKKGGGLNIKKIIMFTNGDIYLTNSVFVNEKCDFALCEIVAKYEDKKFVSNFTKDFPFSLLSQIDPIKNQSLACIGGIGAKSRYPLISSSIGKFESLEKGDVCNNSDIGKLVHTAWVYYGTSGGALFNYAGQVIGKEF